jgi:molybdopterin synthase sulfur carrier subunit
MNSPDAPLNILYFAWLRERIGAAEETVPLPAGVSSVAELIDLLKTRSPVHAAALDPRTIRCAVNQAFADPQTPIGPGDEVAFFPPVTGG